MSVRCNFVAVAVLGFVVLGLIALGFTTFGIYEIGANDAIFRNNGLGDVLTILGMYFTVPYAAILVFFISTVFRFPCDIFKNVHPAHVIVVAVCILILFQQGFTDVYLYLLMGKYAMLVTILDVGVFASLVYLQLSPISGYLYSGLYVLKMALCWDYAYTLSSQPVFGPNGQIAMLFLCIPIMQLPLYASVLAADKDETLADIFVNNFNLFLSHLLQSLDVISMYSFAFTPPYTTPETNAAPAPLKWFILVIVCIAFLSNNCSLLHLFYRRIGDLDAEIPFLPKRFRESVGRGVEEESVDVVARSHHRRMFQYFMLMLVTIDVPFFVTRIVLWRRGYANLDIFVAKNIKDMLDVAMLLIRTEKQRERLALE